jgi:hypothetical protein
VVDEVDEATTVMIWLAEPVRPRSGNPAAASPTELTGDRAGVLDPGTDLATRAPVALFEPADEAAGGLLLAGLLWMGATEGGLICSGTASRTR